MCPVCGQPVQSVVRRHKTLGAWVPRWVPGPCHNAECEAYVEPGTRLDAARHDEGHRHASDPEHASAPASERDAAPERVPESGQGPGAPTARTP